MLETITKNNGFGKLIPMNLNPVIGPFCIFPMVDLDLEVFAESTARLRETSSSPTTANQQELA